MNWITIVLNHKKVKCNFPQKKKKNWVKKAYPKLYRVKCSNIQITPYYLIQLQFNPTNYQLLVITFWLLKFDLKWNY